MNGMLQKEHKPPVLDGIRTQLVLPPWPFAKSREEPCSTVHEEVQFFLSSQSNKDIIGLASNNSLKSSSVFEPYLLRFLPDFLSILCDFGDIEDSTFFWRLRRKAQIRTCSDTSTHTHAHTEAWESKWDNVVGWKWLCFLTLCSYITSRGCPNTAVLLVEECLVLLLDVMQLDVGSGMQLMRETECNVQMGEFRGCENVCMLMQLKQDGGKCDAMPCKLGY